MKFRLATIMMLASMGVSTAADQYDAVYATDPAVCEKKGDDLDQALFDLEASILLPRVGVRMGEQTCRFYDVHMNPSPWGAVQDIYATARCDGPYLAYIDTVSITSDSSNINLAWGDREGTGPASVEMFSIKHGDSTDAVRDPDSYAGVYTICEGLKEADVLP